MNNPMAGTDPTGFAADIVGCTPMTGTLICNPDINTGAENGQTTYRGAVTSTDPQTGTKTTTRFRVGVANGRPVSYTMTGQSVDNGAAKGPAANRSNET